MLNAFVFDFEIFRGDAPSSQTKKTSQYSDFAKSTRPGFDGLESPYLFTAITRNS